MAKFQFDGASQLISTLAKVTNSVQPACGMALYDGAKIVTDEVHKAIENMVEPTYANNMHGIKPERKKGLLDGLGIAEIERKNGVASLKVGFEGYNTIVYPKAPKGEPNVKVARSIEHGRKKNEDGTGGSKKHPFVRPAAKRAKKPAEAAMMKRIDEEISKNM